MLAVIFYRFGWLPGLPERLMVLPWNSPNTRIVHTPRAACPLHELPVPSESHDRFTALLEFNDKVALVVAPKH